MNEDADNFAQAITEWKHKHCIRDDDPMLASLELLELFFQNVRIQIPDSETATIAEVRASIQQLDRLGKDFSKQVRELTLEMRDHPRPKKPSNQMPTFVLAIGCLIAGGIISKLFF